MNFYIGMSVEKLDFNDYNIRIDENIYPTRELNVALFFDVFK